MKLNLKLIKIITFLILNLLVLNAFHTKSLNSLLKKNFLKLASKDLVNLNRSTPDQDWGNGEIFYLDRHDVDCKQGALQGFHLRRPNDKSLAYSYACSNSKAIKQNVISKETPWNNTDNDKRKSAHFLDRHEVKCDNKFALQKFALVRNGDKIHYVYKCVEVNCIDVQTQTTSQTDAGDYSTIYLDRQNIQISSDRVLTGFKLNTKYEKKFLFISKSYYTYTLTTCKLVETESPAPAPAPVPNKPATPNPTPIQTNNVANLGLKTPDNDWGQGSVFFLDRHTVDCKDNNVLQGFVLKQPSQNQISYAYACKSSSAISQDGAYEDKTKENDTDSNENKSANYLDRHNVSCNNNYALQRFKLDRNGNKIFYSFKCVKVKCTDNKTYDTTETDGGDKSITALTKQLIQLETNTVLMGFKLNSRYNGPKTYFKYTITTCKLDETVHPPNPNPNPTPKPTPNPNPSPVETNGVCYENVSQFGKERICKEEKDECRFENPEAEKSGVKKCLPKLEKKNNSELPPLKINEICYRSTPDFNGEKKCEMNLQCRFTDPTANNPPGSTKYCLPPFVAPPQRQLTLGETCFANTPDFNGKQKSCINGLVCRFEDPKLTNQPPNAVMKCMEVDKPLPPPFIDSKKKGKLFCLQNCIIDPLAKEKNCFDKKMKKCKRCTINPTIDDKEKKDVCEAVCNSKTDENLCDFYGYLNNRKKDFPAAILSRYGIEITKR